MDTRAVDSPIDDIQLNKVSPEKMILDRKQEMKTHRVYWFFRRMQDIVLCVLAMIVLSPLMLVVSIAIIIDDPHGGPIFSQVRCGRNNKPFKMYKFRSMYVDAESRLEELMDQNEADGPAFKIANDPRVTKVGRFIRRSSIDELPQLLNIIKGDMSIVGPRPALPREVEQYNEYQLQRLYVQPGLTCYWQIQKGRNNLSFDEWMDLDVKYIKERSFAVDWKIIFKTIGTVFGLDGI